MRHALALAIVCLAGCTPRAPAVDLVDTAGCAREMTPREARAVVRGLDQGAAPEAWEACVGAMWPHLETKARDAAVDALLEQVQHVLRSTPAPQRQVQLDAYVSAWLARPRDVTVRRGPDHPRVRHLRRDLADGTIPEVSAPFAQVVVESVDIENATWHGEAITAELIGGLDDEEALARFVSRLPDPELVAAARVRLVGLRVDHSPFGVVHERRDEVVRAVMEHGHWSPPADAFTRRGLTGDVPPLEIAFSTTSTSARLRARGVDGPVDMRRTLRIDVEGLEQPITTCGEEPDLDPTPCISPGEIRVVGGPAAVEGGGLVLGESLEMQDAVSRSVRRGHVEVSLAIGEVTHTWSLPVSLAHTPRRVYQGAAAAKGPPVEVVAGPLEGEAILLRVFSPADGVTWMAVIDPLDPGDFAVVSRGGRGEDGEPGTRGETGHEGVRGYPADCSSNTPAGDGQRGGQGGPGGPGSDGSPGGPGGDLQVVLLCPDAACSARLRAGLAPLLASEGGEGGRGGEGGPGGLGGPGGEGGMGQACGSGALPPGREGIQGWDGPKGPDGKPGSTGRPGRIEWVTNATPQR